MQDSGLQPERTFLSIERSLFSYIIVNFTFFKYLINKPYYFFYISIFITTAICLYYFVLLINFNKIKTLRTDNKNLITYRLILLSSAIFTIILVIAAIFIIYY